MKKIIALLLVFCMSFGMIVTVSAAPASAFSRSLNLVRLIRSMFAKDDNAPAYGELEDGILTVYVSANGKSDGTGTEKKPFATIEAARDAIRTLDKSEFDGIDVVISGVYTVTEPIAFTAEDSGTKDCPIRYIGKDGATIVGGPALTASDFAPATGEYTSLFPTEAKDKIVQIDLTTLGFTAADIANAKSSWSYYIAAPAISVNGKSMTMARFPNEDWINITENSVIRDKNGEPTTEYDDGSKPNFAQTMEIWYPEEYAERVRSWSKPTEVYMVARLSSLWCTDNARVQSIDAEDPYFTTLFSGGHGVIYGAPIYWYNIPEELDAPGEYIIDDSGILYIYPTEDFDTALISIPVADGLVTMDNTDYITFEGLTFESSLGTSIIGTDTDYLTIKDCEICSNEGDNTIELTGYNITITGNYIHDIAEWGIYITSGDMATLTPGNTVVSNNYIKDTSTKEWPMTCAIRVDGVENLVSHNEIDTCYGMAISNWGAYCVTEYNYIHDALLNGTDMGAIGSMGTQFFGIDNVIRYNYLTNIGPQGALLAIREINEDYFRTAPGAIYPDGATSCWEAYGNIIENVNGDGFMLTCGRDMNIHNNLIINAARYDITYVCTEYAEWYIRGNTSAEYVGKRWANDKEQEYIRSDVWVAARPTLSKIVFDLGATTADDPYSSAAPAGNRFVDNYTFVNKSNRWLYGWKTNISYNIEEPFYKFSVAEEPSIVGTQTLYNSRRDSYTTEDCIEIAAGVVDMTVEQFHTIGIVAEEWNLDVEVGSVATAEKAE